MACNLYVRQNGVDERLGRFKNREAAEDHFRLWKRSEPGRAGVKAIYVETGKGRGKK